MKKHCDICVSSSRPDCEFWSWGAEGDVLASLQPSFGLGVNISPAMIDQAKRPHPDLQFKVGDVEDPEFVASLPGPFDIILIVDTIGALDDCQATIESLH